MIDTTVDNHTGTRKSVFLILRAVAVIAVVVAHSGGPAWLVDAADICGIPLLFLYAGYSFNQEYLEWPKSYIWRRCLDVYRPFWIWSVFFLVFHNFFLYIGFLSEGYGEVMGASQMYTWHMFVQNLWSITFNMSAYDPVLCENFWFFRSLFIGSLLFICLFLAIRKFSRWKSPSAVAALILLLSLVMASWKVMGNLQITGLDQGGDRELMALILMSLGFLYRQYEIPSNWSLLVLGIVLWISFAVFSPSAMVSSANFVQIISLPLPALCAFMVLLFFSQWQAERQGWITQGLVFIGKYALYIFVFHLLTFKFVSIIKVMIYGLPWSYVGDDLVAQESSDDFFYLLYVFLGVALPISAIALWKKMDRTYNLTWVNCLKYVGRGLLFLLRIIKKIILWISFRIWKMIKGFVMDVKAIIKASNPHDE